MPRAGAATAARRLPIVAAVVVAAALLAWWWSVRLSLPAELLDELGSRGRVVVWGPAPWSRLRLEGTELIAAEDHPLLRDALLGQDPRQLAQVMDDQRIQALWIEATDATLQGADSLRARLGSFDYVPGFQGRYLTPVAALYLRDDTVEVPTPLDEVLATVARGILEGATPPRLSGFPEPLRRVRSVEVMVMLERDGEPKLWRSARGSSLARALITAAVVARRRWAERERAMGEALDRSLPSLDVEVALLREDGTLGARQAEFIERVFTPLHGVAYEGRGLWRYLLPRATREVGGGSAQRAYEQLLADHALPGSSLERPDLRLYRIVKIPIARSPASAQARR